VERLRVTTEGDRWLRPNGRLIVPFAPHNQYTMFADERGWRQPREADYRRFAGWGFNATRLEIKHCHLEPTEGPLAPGYLALMQRVIEWADKYGIYVSVDLHWPYPEWFYQGPEGLRNANREEQNPYQNPDALVATFRRLVATFARYPNILCWEIPTNEPAVSSIEVWHKEENRPTIEDIPYLMRSWNHWLKARYGTRTDLDSAWRGADQFADRNGLGSEENWDNNSVLPPGLRGVPKGACRRIYDYMEWAVQQHTDLCGRIADVIHERLPRAVTQQQYMAGGGRWEHDPIPVSLTKEFVAVEKPQTGTMIIM